jgi:hypothetical protein
MTAVNYSTRASRDRPPQVLPPPRCSLLAGVPLSASEYTTVSQSDYRLATESISPDAIARAVT